MKILSANNIKKDFGKTEVLKDISVDVNEGEVLAIIGPSGSGKSTLLRCITQLETIDSGEIVICGETLVKTGENGKAQYADKKTCVRIGLNLGLVFQNFNLFPHFSVLRNITEAAVTVLKTPKDEAEKAAYELLDKMGLRDRAGAYPHQLSGGQQQRVAIARALALHPDILCFDEPTSALDPELIGEVLRVLRELAEHKTTMIIVTHEMKFARDAADRILFMDGGVVVEQGDAKELIDHPKEERTRQFLASYGK